MEAKEILVSGGYTCVLTDGAEVHTSFDRGVKPLVRFLESGKIPAGLSAADKVVGRATAYLAAGEGSVLPDHQPACRGGPPGKRHQCGL